jgi:hypothetical protein
MLDETHRQRQPTDKKIHLVITFPFISQPLIPHESRVAPRLDVETTVRSFSKKSRESQSYGQPPEFDISWHPLLSWCDDLLRRVEADNKNIPAESSNQVVGSGT